MPVCNGVTILFWKTGIHKVLSIKPGALVYDVLMLGEIEFALLNTRWMYPGRTNHLFCSIHVSSSVPCQLCWLSDQSPPLRAGRPCNFILTTINVNTLPVTSLRLFQELNVLVGECERDFENSVTLNSGWETGWDMSTQH